MSVSDTHNLTMMQTVVPNYCWFSKIVSRVWPGPGLLEVKCLNDNCKSLFSITLKLGMALWH